MKSPFADDSGDDYQVQVVARLGLMTDLLPLIDSDPDGGPLRSAQ
jgi:hypothetical protein